MYSFRSAVPRRRAERGAAAVVVGILLGGGVLLGASALAVDVGSILWERRQLQNGSDASSLALAKACVNTPSTCKATNPAIATLNKANASDAKASTDIVCARFAGTTYTTTATPALPACASATDTTAAAAAKEAGLSECLPLPDWLKGTDGSKIPYVEVKAGTDSDAAGSALPSIFSRAVTGNDNPHVTACSRAAWGPAGGFTGSLPIAISICEWQSYTGSDLTAGIPGSAVGPPEGAYPGYGGAGQPAWPTAYQGWPNKVNHELYVLTHSATGTECSYKGKDTDGGFGWLDSGGGSCTTSISTNAANEFWAEISTGNNVPNDCKTVIESYYGKVVQLPVFDCLTKSGSVPTQPVSAIPSCTESGGGGSKTWYHLRGFASFYLSGNKLTNSTTQDSKINGKTPCSPSSNNVGGNNPWSGNSARCISGWFVSATLTAPSISPGGPGGGNFGTNAVAPAG